MLTLKRTLRFLRDESGFVLPVAVILSLVLAISGAAFLTLGTHEIKSVQRRVRKSQAFYVAEAGTKYGIFRLQTLLNTTPDSVSQADLDDIGPPTISGCTFDTLKIEKQGIETTKILKDLTAVTQEYKITCQATGAESNPYSAKIVQTVEDQIFYTFQFGVLYDQDLEILPGPDMTFMGRVHSNNDIYLDCNGTLSIDAYLTTAKDIHKGSKPGSTPGSGTVRIKDTTGVYQVMDFDSDSTNWAARADSVWGGKVQSQDHGIGELALPIPTPEDPIQIIKRVNESDPLALKKNKLHYQADLSIIDGVARGPLYAGADTVIDLTYISGEDTLNPIASKSLKDHREGAEIELIEVDIAKLIESGKFPANGILYVSQSGSDKAVRLANGSELPEGGLTVATDNPIYVQGDYNTEEEQPASVLCDALNILSKHWDEQNDASAGWGSREASETEVNACIMTGFTRETSVENGYSGGLENLPRFLENWTGVEFTYSGSMISLWYSQQATGDWKYGNPCYTAPNRIWSYNQELLDPANLPPGTPELRVLEKIGWQQDF